MRYLSIFTLLVASSSFASAAIITIACGPQQSSINAGVVTPGALAANCAAQNFGGGTVITNFSLGFSGAFSDGNPNNSSQVSDSYTSTVGNGGPINTGIDNLSSNTGFIQNLNAQTPGTPGFGAFTVNVTTTSIGVSVPDSAQFSVFATYTYEVQQTGGVPEPSTLALVGGVLALAGIRKFRR